MSIENYLIKQIQQNLCWLAENTDVAWDIVSASYPNEPEVHGIRFQDSVHTITTIWEAETL